MSRRFVVVAEDRLSFLLATALCDRVVAERSRWLRDHWHSEEDRSSFRVWSTLDASSAAAWTTRADVKRLAATTKVSAHPLGLKAEGALAYKATKLALSRLAETDALFLVHDTDGEESTAERMREGAESAKKSAEQLTVIVAAPHPEAEAWVAAGIVPATPEEKKRREEQREHLGFDPITEPHLLSSGKSTNKRDAKRACREILGAFDDEPERWRRCWEETALELLEANGEEAGLPAYTREVEERILSLLGDPMAATERKSEHRP
jgi:hypothetical protein